MTLRVVLALLAVAVTSCATTDKSYTVRAGLAHRGETFATPIVALRNNAPATVEVSGAGGYTLTLTVTDFGDDKLRIATRLQSSYGSIDPVILVEAGQTASVSVGDLGLTLTVNR
jgi:archaellum component FlaG (FlaF/FlaG flagellin family)